MGEGDWRISADCHFHLVCCPQLPPLYAQIQLRVSQSPLLFSVQPPHSANGSIAQTYCCYYLKPVSRVCLNEGFDLFPSCSSFFFKLVQHMIFGFRLFYIAVSFREVQSPRAQRDEITIVHGLPHSFYCLPPQCIFIPLRLSQLIKSDIYWRK